LFPNIVSEGNLCAYQGLQFSQRELTWLAEDAIAGFEDPVGHAWQPASWAHIEKAASALSKSEQVQIRARLRISLESLSALWNKRIQVCVTCHP
jgi:hypothetical protein